MDRLEVKLWRGKGETRVSGTRRRGGSPSSQLTLENSPQLGVRYEHPSIPEHLRQPSRDKAPHLPPVTCFPRTS